MRDAHGCEALESVADFYVVEIGDTRSAFKSSANFSGVFLEALQRAERSGVNDRAIAHYAHLRVAFQNAIDDEAACDRAGSLDLENVAHFGVTDNRFLENWIEQAEHGFLHFVADFINDGVVANVHVFALSEFGGFAFGAYVESDDHRAGCGREKHVSFADRANT